MVQSQIVVDQWAPLSHKELVGYGLTAPPVGVAPSWVPAEDRRRLAAYIARAAYIGNVARQLLPQSVKDTRRAAHREYGEAALLVDRVVAGVLGDWTLTVDGAAGSLASGPSLPERPAPAPENATPLEQRIATIAQKAWDDEAEEIVAAWEQAVATQPIARARQATLREWAEHAEFAARLEEAEHDAAGLADAVYVLWPRANDWPLLQVIDPGMYFPELEEDGGLGSFPDRTHLAWEYDRRGSDGKSVRWVRRITHQLVDIAATRSSPTAPVWIDPLTGAESDTPTLYEGESLTPEGRIVRSYPWHEEGQAPSPMTCIVTDASWPLDKVKGTVYDEWDWTHAEVRSMRADLGCDFLPVVHVPNTPTGKDHFGRSVIDNGAQVLDDLAVNDTDSMRASRYLGDPTIALSGATAVDGAVAPGRIFSLGPTGQMTVLDLSAGIDKLMAAGDRLQDRFWQTSRVPAEMLGRADTSGPVAGVTLALRFAPFAQIVGTMRLVRAAKYELLFRMVQRLGQVAKELEPGPSLRARLEFGNFLPTNRAETIELVASALQAKAISRQTGLLLLISAGLPIEDAKEELERIAAEDGETAKAIADATGSDELGAAYLGLTLPTATPTVRPGPAPAPGPTPPEPAA